MNDITAFFAFLRYSLGNKGNMSRVIAGMNWQELYSFASKQALLGLCFDGIERLEREYSDELRLNPIRPVMLMTWMGKAQQIRRQNMKVNMVASKLYSKFREDGLRCCILKGQGKPSPGCAGWDRMEYACELKYLGLWKFAGAVMYVLHEALGLSEEKMIAPMDEKRGKLLLSEIMNGGNFGQHFTKYGHFTQQGMAKKYFLKIWRNMHFVRYYPAEALSEPIFRTWHFFWRMKNKRS